MSALLSPLRPQLRQFLERHWLFVLLLLSASVVEYLAATRGGPGPSLGLVRNPFAAIAAATVFCRYWLYDRGRTRKWVVYLTPVTWLAALVVEGAGAPPVILWLDTLAAIGLLGVLGFVLAACTATDPRARSRSLNQLMDALVLPLSASMVSYGLWSTHRLNPVYDGRVYAFEEILGVRFSLVGVWSYRTLMPLSAVATACYSLLAVAIAGLAAAQRDSRREQDILAATVIAGACGFALYFACPVVGPLTAFGPLYPSGLPPISLDTPLLTAPSGPPRNGMPSLHTIWALLLWFNAQTLPVALRRGLRVFAALTMWAVMGLDDTHWLMDAVVAVPLAVAIQVLVVSGKAAPARATWTTAGVCLAITGAWLWAFRVGPPFLTLHPIAAWSAVAATVIWPLARAGALPSRRRRRQSTPSPAGAAVRVHV